MTTKPARAALATALSLASAGVIQAQDDRPPSEPGEPTARSYSATAGEIAWQRSVDDSGAIPGYEVRRNGVVLDVLDALSYNEVALESGTTYVYEITAIDRYGQRSTPARVSLTTDGPPAAPTGLRSVVYSKTAGAIAWSRPAREGLVYDVSRDGSAPNRTDGTSFVDATLSPGTRYIYAVVAIDQEGRASSAASITLDTPGVAGSGQPTNPPPDTDTDTGSENGDGDDDITLPSTWAPTTSITDLAVPAGLYARDGYKPETMARFDIETVIGDGPCIPSDLSGCTFADVLADENADDDLRPEIDVHFLADDFPEDGRTTNAEMRLRGSSSRLFSRKSFRVEFKGSGVRWRDEDKLQLKKTPIDGTQIKEKLAFTLMEGVPNFPSSNTQFVNLWIDDGAGPENYGAFTHTEAAGGEFFDQRNWDKEGKLYKAERFVFSASEDLPRLTLDENGEPVDKDEFETRLEIEFKGDRDHRPLVRMLEAVDDREQDFGAVLERHFDRDNLVTWLAVNLLLRQLDSVTHNYYLYNPANSEKFYFLPWDYDQTFGVEAVPSDELTNTALSERLYYGLGRYQANTLIAKLMREQGFFEALTAKARALRNGPLSDARTGDLARRYVALVEPVALTGPDRYAYSPLGIDAFGQGIGDSLTALETGILPLAPRLEAPEVRDNEIQLAWSAAFDITGELSLTYDIEIASSPDFAPGELVMVDTGIADERDRILYVIPAGELQSGTYFVRLIARASGSSGPVWQIADNRESFDGQLRVGMRRFVIP